MEDRINAEPKIPEGLVSMESGNGIDRKSELVEMQKKKVIPQSLLQATEVGSSREATGRGEKSMVSLHGKIKEPARCVELASNKEVLSNEKAKS